MFGAIARGVFGVLMKGGPLALLAGGSAVAADQVIGGGSMTEKVIGGVGKTIGYGQNEAAFEGSYNRWGQFIEMISRFLKDLGLNNGFSRSLEGLATRMQGHKRGEALVDDTPSMAGVVAPAVTVGGLVGGKIALKTLTAAGAPPLNAAFAKAVGARAIPIVGGAVAALDAVSDVGGFALKGEWEKAGVRTVSGIADTVGSSFGVLGYAFGVATREVIENTGELVLGEKAHLEDSATMAVLKSGVKAFTPSGP